MAIDFPNSPTTNQIFTVGSRSWKWDGTIWAIYSNNPVLYRQDSPPSSPQEGDQWFETDTGRMFVRYGTAWVELGNATDIAGALQPGQMTALSAITSLTSDDIFPVVDGPSSAVASSKITYGNLVTNMSASLASGLVLVKTQTVGTGVSSVTVTSAFSSAYDNYLITLAGGTISADGDISIKLGASATGYYAFLNYGDFSSNTPLGAARNNQTQFNWVGGGAAGQSAHVHVQVFGPNKAAYTKLLNGTYQSGGGYGTVQGEHRLATAYTDFILTPGAGTLTGGTIRVYGYRNS
jgi:hypothetical protein